MNKNFYSLGLMSGTSIDGIDASIIKSDGKQSLKVIDNFYLEYEESFRKKLKKSIDSCITKSRFQNQLKNIKKIEKKITYLHEKACKLILNRNKNINIDLIGFHGQTYLHKPQKKISIQIGNAELLFKLTGINIISHFRDNDILNGGEGAPLTPIYHKLIKFKKKILNPVSFLNIGGIANITYFDEKNVMRSRDIGPGNCLIDKWIRLKSDKKYDKKGLIARSGTVDKFILNRSLDSFYNSKISKKKSYDINDFDLSFVKELTFKNGASTLTEFTADICSKKITNKNIYVSGGGRRNTFLLESIKKKINCKIRLIDTIGIDGDFVESQAFAYLAVRSYLKLPISFPTTTGVKNDCTGGEAFKFKEQ